MTTTIDGSAGITTNAGGSVNPSTNISGVNFSCRAWANFNGVTTVTIAGSGNIASIVRNSAGNYTVTFTTAMADANYSVVGSAPGDNTQPYVFSPASFTTTTFVITTTRTALAFTDASLCCFAVFR